MKRSRFGREHLSDAVRGSTSLRQVLLRLNVSPFGGNYDVLRRALRRFDIDTSHFTGRSWSRGRQLSARKPTAAYLANVAPIQSYKLKRRLLREGVLEPRCGRCMLAKWQDLPIPLELDHINGNNRDNRLENLRLLCPNCHALTPTYRSKRRPGLSSVLQPP
jgi:5-methylcytosine-specific restriction endonuclease McrA